MDTGTSTADEFKRGGKYC